MRHARAHRLLLQSQHAAAAGARAASPGERWCSRFGASSLADQLATVNTRLAEGLQPPPKAAPGDPLQPAADGAASDPPASATAAGLSGNVAAAVEERLAAVRVAVGESSVILLALPTCLLQHLLKGEGM